ncbi:hypothetical protein MHBO_004724 [Bonamia ostreae]|uniref:Uncharacterized protein n=1 Tax=Bonamia ostreae TaxID=126728 RepID=A0ABV2AU34_9EUKA
MASKKLLEIKSKYDKLKLVNDRLKLQNKRIFDKSFKFPGKNLKKDNEDLQRIRAKLSSSLKQVLEAKYKNSKDVRKHKIFDTFDIKKGNNADQTISALKNATETVDSISENEDFVFLALAQTETALQYTVDYYEDNFIVVLTKLAKYFNEKDT